MRVPLAVPFEDEDDDGDSCATRTSADLRSLALSLWTWRARLKVRMARKRMATASAPTTSSSQLAGRKEVMEDGDDEELDAVPFAVSRLRSIRFPISLLSSGMHLQLLVKSKTYFEEHSWRVESGQRHMHLEGSHTRPDS